MIDQPKNARRFIKSSIIDATLDAIMDFHNDPRALGRLTPPPIIMQLRRDDRLSLTEGEIEFTLWFGPLPIRWIARHESGPRPCSFADVQVKGPLAYWRHEHIFTEVRGGVELTDRITLAHRPGPLGLFTRLAFDGLPLRILFAYRHWRTRRALSA
ncbi:MAG: SRPBCC family protein [Chloroflexi bacterium]|nr:SRPBCC family protein [Chloroflexota bacterium]